MPRVKVTPKIPLNIARAGKQFKPGLNRAMNKINRKLVRSAKANATSRVLTKRTGRLARSVIGEVVSTAKGQTLTISSDTPYSWIHEAGGQAGRNHSVHIRKRNWLSRVLVDNNNVIRKELADFIGTLGR